MAAHRGRPLTVLAILFAILAVSNLSKPLQLTHTAGFVLLGQRLDGTANTIAGPLAGVFLATYAWGIWTMRRWALPMAWVYAAYVVSNLVLFPLRTPTAGELPIAFMVIYAIIAIGGSVGAALFLRQRRPALE